jgi:hypothetical protein
VASTKVTKKRKKEILHKNIEDMTAFEVLKSIPIGDGFDLSFIFSCHAIHRAFSPKPFSCVTLHKMFHRQLTDPERLLIAERIRYIAELGLHAAHCIENGLIER